LDWTRSHLTAAYFAAVEGHVRSRERRRPQARRRSKEKLSVWAFEYSEYLTYKDEIDIRFGRPKSHRPAPPAVELVSAPHSGNLNLHAQDGVFTLFRPLTFDPESAIDRRPLDHLAKDTFPYRRVGMTIFYEVTLPVTAAGSLMWSLAREGVDASRLFPGYAGVVRCLAEE
jgi:hypothetical protein